MSGCSQGLRNRFSALIVGVAAVAAATSAECDTSVGESDSAALSLLQLAVNLKHADSKASLPTQGVKTLGSTSELKGEGFHIFRPFLVMPDISDVTPLLASPESWLNDTVEVLSYLDDVSTIAETTARGDSSIRGRALVTYAEYLKSFVSATAYGGAEMSVKAQLHGGKATVVSFDPKKRSGGEDWTYLGTTMTGQRRLTALEDILGKIFKDKVPGHIIETGAWRGGSSIFARGITRAQNEGSQRLSYVCDSFAGLPPRDKHFSHRDAGWDGIPYLSVSAKMVAANFQRAGVLDPNVVFVKGFFNVTMPQLAPQVDKLALMRLDGDMYQSTADVLYLLYDKLSIGGYVIIDDWFGFPARDACKDFFAMHQISPKIHVIDKLSIYWRKDQQVDVQRWRQKYKKFKPAL